jgi:hypothetical protein
MSEYLWISYIANNPGKNVLCSASPDGNTWQPNLDIDQSSTFSPSFAYFRDRLYVAFIANNSGQNVLVCSTANGLNWEPLDGTPGSNPDIGQASTSAPSLAVFNGRLYIAFVANNSGQNVVVCSTSDGKSWLSANGDPGANSDIGQAAGFDPALASYHGRLYVAFIANNSGQNVLVCSTSDGKNWLPANGKPGASSDTGQAGGSSPSLAGFNKDDRLYVAFLANNSGKNVLVCSTADGLNWEPLDGALGGKHPAGYSLAGDHPLL